MNPFECCHFCVPPKRHTGCHSTCPEYKEARAIQDEINYIRDLGKDTKAYVKNSQEKHFRKKHLRKGRR